MTNDYPKSRELYDRACKVLAGGVSSAFRKFEAPHPMFYEHAAGSRITDVDGNEFLDFTLSQGPLILGHSHPAVLDAVHKASAGGQLFGGQHEAEVALAEKLQGLIPCAERIRFSLSGSEANHAALRVARAVTGRSRFVRFEGQYHGWFDNVSFAISAPSEAALGNRENPNLLPWTDGLPADAGKETVLLPWNDLALVEKTIEKQHEEIAAVITEPVMCNSGCIPPAPGFLEGLRRLCDAYDIVLIFDEVITGFRLGMGGAQVVFGVTPDLAVFGKAMASGYPISVLAGRERIMQPITDGSVIHAGTMNAGHASIAAALATLEVLENEGVHAQLYRHGKRLMDGLRSVASDAGHDVLIQGPGPVFHMGFTTAGHVRDYRDTFNYDTAAYAAFMAGMRERGVRLIGRGIWYLSGAHTEADLEQCLDAAKDVFEAGLSVSGHS